MTCFYSSSFEKVWKSSFPFTPLVSASFEDVKCQKDGSKYWNQLMKLCEVIEKKTNCVEETDAVH